MREEKYTINLFSVWYIRHLVFVPTQALNFMEPGDEATKLA